MHISQILNKYRSLSYVDILSRFSENTIAEFKVQYYPNKSIESHLIDMNSCTYSNEDIEQLAHYVGKPKHFSMVGESEKDLLVVYNKDMEPVLQGDQLNDNNKEYIVGLISKGLYPNNIAQIYHKVIANNDFGIRLQNDNKGLIIARHGQDNTLNFKQYNGFSFTEFEKFLYSYLKKGPIDYELGDFKGLAETENTH